MIRRLLALLTMAILFAAPAFAVVQNPAPADPPVSDADIKALAAKLRALALAQNPQVQKQIQDWLQNGGQMPNDLQQPAPPQFPPINPNPPQMPENREPRFFPDKMPRPQPRPQLPGNNNPGQMPQLPKDFDPFNNPLQNEQPNPNALGGRNTDINGFVKFWEKNFGPLDQTPELKNALLDLMKNAEGEDFGKDFFNDLDGKGGAGDEFKGFGDWFDGHFGGGDWKLPELGLKDWFPKNDNAGGGRRGDGGGWGGFNLGDWSIGSFGGGDGAGTWLPVILFVAILVVALIAWRFWPGGESKERSVASAVQRLGSWPVDPRTIANREDLVRAFEYLSVLLCGSAAKVWNHHTIAAALRAKLPESEAYADELAHLYELAKYTSVGEPLPATALADARRCLCQLAGVTPA